MKHFLYLCIATLIFSVCAESLFSQSHIVVNRFDTGTIDWTNRTITSTGIATSDTLKKTVVDEDKNRLYKKAKISASKNLFTTMGKIQIHSNGTIGNYITSRQDILKQIQLMINTAQIIKKESLNTGSATITLQVNLDGGLAQLVLPEEIIQIEPIKTLQQPPSELESSEFTGIIIDARGLKIVPAMSPRIVDENSTEVYGPAFISREHAVQSGTVQYVKTMIDNDRTGKNPIIVTGLKTLPDNSSDIVISTADASKLHSSSDNLDLLHQGKVIIVLDFPEL